MRRPATVVVLGLQALAQRADEIALLVGCDLSASIADRRRQGIPGVGPCCARSAARGHRPRRRPGRHASAIAAGIASIDGAEVLNDVVYTQLSASFGDDARTPRGDRAAPGGRHDLDVRLALAGSRGAQGVGEQLVDRRRRRRCGRRRCTQIAASRPLGAAQALQINSRR